VHHRTIQINHQPDTTVFQFIILTFVYSSTCFGRFPAHHQELSDCSGSLWYYLRIVVTVVLCSWLNCTMMHGLTNLKFYIYIYCHKLLHQVGDLFELNVKLRCEKLTSLTQWRLDSKGWWKADVRILECGAKAENMPVWILNSTYLGVAWVRDW
jgi:hypothetical protein